VKYVDPSHWRKIVGLKLTDEDKKHNKMVSKGLVKGRITPKHLSVRIANSLFALELILKNNDVADSILLGHSYLVEGK